ncbi:uncharacterized protein LOC129587487 [Paramacrobiotus metropolitanus]|uniref:uncharacterized protein LOC129587487 n=1 Tax=Paramacrobiotus metropolitanus TaxID=2943436 RepID=UPI002445727F|nr:uncharacterized protein LOC129587487 [Paramacrobiotus metropolitanus]
MDSRQTLQHLDEMLYFPQEYGATECNVANTVLMNHGDQNWHLAYIQDIHEDSFLLNFISSSTTASWVNSKYIWPHYLIPSQPLHDSVFVAVRNELNGPFVFRPARLVFTSQGESSSHDRLKLHHVQLDVAGEDGKTVSLRRIVHHWQLAESLPYNEPSFATRVSPQRYAKFKIQWPAAGPQDVIGWDILRSWIQDMYFRNAITGLCRYFTRINANSAIFIIWLTRDNENELHECLSKIRRSFRYSSISRKPAQWGELSELNFSGNERSPGGTCGVGLPIEIFLQIFFNLDAQSHVKIKRVCTLWNAIYERYENGKADMTFLVENFPIASYNWDRNAYRFAVLLDRTISKRIKVISLITNANSRATVGLAGHVDLLIAAMKIRNINNYLICIKDREIAIPQDVTLYEHPSGIFADFFAKAGTIAKIQCVQYMPTDVDRYRLISDTSTVYRDDEQDCRRNLPRTSKTEQGKEIPNVIFSW